MALPSHPLRKPAAFLGGRTVDNHSKGPSRNVPDHQHNRLEEVGIKLMAWCHEEPSN